MSDEVPPKPSSLPPTAQFTGRTSIAPDDEQDFEVDDPGLDRVERVGHFRLDREIARGGMGVVYQAFDELLHRDVAVKLLQHRFRHNPSLCQRFVNETLLTGRLQHPGVVPIYACGEAEDQRPFFAMKLVGGLSLAQLLSLPQHSRPDRSQLLKMFEQVCQTIAFAHTQQVLHLDLKPANIMVGEFGEVHVMDWGLSRTIRIEPGEDEVDPASHTSIADSSQVCGTAAYMAPEQARGDQLCVRTDVFGLGALLCEILTGRPPYRGRSQRRIYHRALQGNLRDALIRLDRSGRDQRLVLLTKSCLAAERQDRPHSARQVGAEVANYLESMLEQAESDLCRFFELTLDLFCIANMEGFFERVNMNFPRVLGYSEEELIRRPYIDLVHPDDVLATSRTMQRLREGESVISFTNRYRCAAGHFVQLEWTARTLPDEGRVFAIARIREEPPGSRPKQVASS